ncbi:hypothetical protein LXL04_016898 [Taraxacum kok-saghyz]
MSSLDFSKVTAPNAPNCPPFITGPCDGADEEDGGHSGGEDGDILKQRSSPAMDSPSTIAEEFLTTKPLRHNGRILLECNVAVVHILLLQLASSSWLISVWVHIAGLTSLAQVLKVSPFGLGPFHYNKIKLLQHTQSVALGLKSVVLCLIQHFTKCCLSCPVHVGVNLFRPKELKWAPPKNKPCESTGKGCKQTFIHKTEKDNHQLEGGSREGLKLSGVRRKTAITTLENAAVFLIMVTRCMNDAYNGYTNDASSGNMNVVHVLYEDRFCNKIDGVQLFKFFCNDLTVLYEDRFCNKIDGVELFKFFCNDLTEWTTLKNIEQVYVSHLGRVFHGPQKCTICNYITDISNTCMLISSTKGKDKKYKDMVAETFLDLLDNTA